MDRTSSDQSGGMDHTPEQLLSMGYTPEQVLSLINMGKLTPEERRAVSETLFPREKSPFDVLMDQAKDVLANGQILQLAVEEPAQRQQAHDDDDPVVIHPYVIGLIGLCDPEKWKGRGELIGAVICHGEEVWMLVNLKRTLVAEFMDHLRQACDREGPESYARFWTNLPPDERKNWKEPSRAFPKYFARRKA